MAKCHLEFDQTGRIGWRCRAGLEHPACVPVVEIPSWGSPYQAGQ